MISSAACACSVNSAGRNATLPFPKTTSIAPQAALAARPAPAALAKPLELTPETEQRALREDESVPE